MKRTIKSGKECCSCRRLSKYLKNGLCILCRTGIGGSRGHKEIKYKEPIILSGSKKNIQ